MAAAFRFARSSRIGFGESVAAVREWQRLFREAVDSAKRGDFNVSRSTAPNGDLKVHVIEPLSGLGANSKPKTVGKWIEIDSSKESHAQGSSSWAFRGLGIGTLVYLRGSEEYPNSRFPGDAAIRPASMGLRATLHRRDPWTWGPVEHASDKPKHECAKCSDRTWKLYRSRAEAFADHGLPESKNR